MIRPKREGAGHSSALLNFQLRYVSGGVLGTPWSGVDLPSKWRSQFKSGPLALERLGD